MLERASGIPVRKDDRLSRVHYFGGFRHKVDTAEGDYIGIGGFGMVGESQGVAYIVRDILDVSGPIVVCKNDGVPLLFKREDFFLEIESGGHGWRVWCEIQGFPGEGDLVISIVPVCFAPGFTINDEVRTRPWRRARFCRVMVPVQDIWPRTWPSMVAEVAVPPLPCENKTKPQARQQPPKAEQNYQSPV